MTRKRFHRVTICLTETEYHQFKRIAGIRKENVSQFIRYLVNMHLKMNKPLVDLMDEIDKASIAKSS